MNILDFIDVLHELIAVDTECGLIESTFLQNNTIAVTLNNGSIFKITVTQHIA